MQFLVMHLLLFQVNSTLVQIGLCEESNFDYATHQMNTTSDCKKEKLEFVTKYNRLGLPTFGDALHFQ